MATGRRATSRMIKREKQKMMRQTMLFGGIALGIVIIFIVLILPGFIGIVNSMLNTNPFEATDNIPPQPPVISTPVEATTSAKLAVSGFGEAESQLTLVLNSEKTAEIKIAEDRTFAAEIKLNEGENILEAYATDEAGNESAMSRSITIFLDTEDPFIELNDLQDGQEIIGKNNENYQLSGKTEPRAQMEINDRAIFTNADGSFSTTLRLNEGENKIKLKAKDQAGNTTEIEITVRFRY